MNLDELRALPAVIDVPAAGKILGLGVSASYAAARRGDFEVLRIGKKLIVPTARLLALLGVPASPVGGDPVGENQ